MQKKVTTFYKKFRQLPAKVDKNWHQEVLSSLLAQPDQNWPSEGTKLTPSKTWLELATKRYPAHCKPNLTKTGHQGGGQAQYQPNFTRTGHQGALSLLPAQLDQNWPTGGIQLDKIWPTIHATYGPFFSPSLSWELRFVDGSTIFYKPIYLALVGTGLSCTN